jgi:Spy/CpxP family protein refolding chaperone
MSTSTKTLRILLCGICLALVPCARSLAQGGEGGGGDRDRPGGPGGPGGPGSSGGIGSPAGPGGPGAPRELNHPRSAHDKVSGQPHNSLQFGPVGRWWDDKTVVQSIGLRREQQKRMDTIFDANKPAILDSYKTFLKAQANLAAVNKDPQADKTKVFAAIDAVNEARSSLQKATSAMLLQIRQEMDPTQITKLENVP